MKKITVLLATVLMFAVFILNGCCAAGPANTADIENSTWILEYYGEPDNLQAILEGTEVTAIFSSEEDRLTGSGGCNTYFGDYQVKESELSIPVLASTEMACIEPEGVMEQEQEYLSTLQAAESYTIEGTELEIFCGNKILVFSKE